MRMTILYVTYNIEPHLTVFIAVYHIYNLLIRTIRYTTCVLKTGASYTSNIHAPVSYGMGNQETHILQYRVNVRK